MASKDGAFLAGKTIAITASRRAEEQAAAFERHGAAVVLAPTVRIVKTDDDARLLAATEQVIATGVQMVLVATGHGLKSWVDAAEKADLGEKLREVLAAADFYVRGAKGRGAVRALGFRDSGIAEVETTESLVELALDKGVSGKRVLMQQHGLPDPALVQRLEAAGAQVLEVHPNRWEQPEHPELVEQLIQSLLEGKLDAITFTAAPAFEAMLARAASLGKEDEVLAALAKLRVAAVGPVTAEPMLARGLNPLVPERSRMGAMVKDLTKVLAEK